MCGSCPAAAGYHNLYCLYQSLFSVFLAKMNVCAEVWNIMKGAVFLLGVFDITTFRENIK
jgi:hypothetical protein